jgi:hypothetical protein
MIGNTWVVEKSPLLLDFPSKPKIVFVYGKNLTVSNQGFSIGNSTKLSASLSDPTVFVRIIFSNPHIHAKQVGLECQKSAHVFLFTGTISNLFVWEKFTKMRRDLFTGFPSK